MLGNLFTLKQLEALVWVSDLGSFRKAAERLNTTQPNISARIAGLEAALGVSLMDRGAGALKMTQKGQAVLAQARKVLREGEALLEVAERTELTQGQLRLGVTELIACTWLHDYLRGLKARFPQLTVELTVDLAVTLDKLLGRGELDLVVQNAPFETPVSGCIALGDCAYVWVAAPQIAQLVGGVNTVGDLLAHGVLTHARHTQAFGALADHAAQQDIAVSGFASSSSITACAQMAADGMGVALLPEALVASHLAAGSLEEVAVDWLPEPLSFAVRFQAERAALHVHQAAKLAQEVSEAKG